MSTTYPGIFIPLWPARQLSAFALKKNPPKAAQNFFSCSASKSRHPRQRYNTAVRIHEQDNRIEYGVILYLWSIRTRWNTRQLCKSLIKLSTQIDELTVPINVMPYQALA